MNYLLKEGWRLDELHSYLSSYSLFSFKDFYAREKKFLKVEEVFEQAEYKMGVINQILVLRIFLNK